MPSRSEKSPLNKINSNEAAGTGPVSKAYEALVAKGALAGDELQRDAVRVLDEIAGKVEAREAFNGFLGGLFKKTQPIEGAYLYGDVGRGKSMLMDLFFASVDIKAKRRVHFHEFMDEIHAAIAKFRAKSKLKGEDGDPVAAAVKPILKSVKLLCLDEFHVNDITNAMLLGRLFEKLFAGGMVLVTTSNVKPDGLYMGGLNRELILPFIALLKNQVRVITLDGPTDYRRLKFEGQQVYFFRAEARAGLDQLWSRLTGGAGGEPTEIESLGRKIHVPRAAMGAARFEFSEICEKPLGARDYLRLAHAFDAMVIDDVPQFDRTRSNAAKRFILLVDTLYDRGVKLAASFAVPLEELGADEKTRFEFARCVSRLIEMGSEDYLNAARKAEPASL